MDGSQVTKRYVLDDACALVPCDDPQEWEAWMSNPDNCTILKSKVPVAGREVHTVFTGENVGDDEFPVYFLTSIHRLVGRVNVLRDHEAPILQCKSATWAEALVHHDQAIAAAMRNRP